VIFVNSVLNKCGINSSDAIKIKASLKRLCLAGW